VVLTQLVKTWFYRRFGQWQIPSGKPYNPNGLTAASRNMPMGSTIKVTDPDTGHSVTVRIKDRSPLGHGRSLDLSKSAAEHIGITDGGVARVRVKAGQFTPDRA
jgi:rare lipoprotein A